MSKRAPSTTQLLVIAGFALSCFGILLFLWITFGGPTPFKAKSYEINVPFKEATQLAQQSDVRISGVSVGKVQDIVLAPNGEQAMAKVDINGLTQQLSRELGGQNIRINAIAPGPIDTEANRTTTPKEIVDDIVKGLPLSRMGTPEDLVGMCLFLLSDEASWITGQIFNVDGGQVIRS